MKKHVAFLTLACCLSMVQGQNVHGFNLFDRSKTNFVDYYNMDTTGSKTVSRYDTINWNNKPLDYDMDEHIPQGDYRHIYVKTITMPLFIIKDSFLLYNIDNSFRESVTEGSVNKPDKSGVYLELSISSLKENPSYIEIWIKPESNYYMNSFIEAYELYNWRKELRSFEDCYVGAFYFDSAILGIVRVADSASLNEFYHYFTPTRSKINIHLYKDERITFLRYYGPKFIFYNKKNKYEGHE